MQIHQITFHLIFDPGKISTRFTLQQNMVMPQLYHFSSPRATVQMTQNLGQFQKQIRKFYFRLPYWSIAQMLHFFPYLRSNFLFFVTVLILPGFLPLNAEGFLKTFTPETMAYCVRSFFGTNAIKT